MTWGPDYAEWGWWRVRNGRGRSVRLYVCPGIAPVAHELHSPIPGIGAARGDLVVYAPALRVVGTHHPFGRAGLHALRDAFGGRANVADRLAEETTVRYGEHQWPGSVWSIHDCVGDEMGRILKDARQWSSYLRRGNNFTVVPLGTQGRVSRQVEADSDLEAVELLIATPGECLEQRGLS